ncbi:MAG: ABC transporter permease [bacterium]|nr:ABC transporter permease [bacterium]
MNISLFISFRYFFNKRKQIFATFINFLSVIGVALGVVALIIALSIMNGFQKNLTERVFASNSSINLILSSESQTQYQKITQELSQVKEIKSISPFVIGNGLIKKGKYSAAAVVKGVTEEELKATNIGKYIEVGSFINNRRRGVVIGSKLAQEIGVYLGDDITFISPEMDFASFPAMPGFFKFEVMGIFNTGIFDYDSRFIYVQLAYAQDIFELGHNIQGYGIGIEDVYAFAEVEDSIYNVLKNMGENGVTRSWFESNSALFSALKMEKVVMAIVLFLIIVIASFGMVSSLFILTIEKTRDIGILKTIGFSKKKIRQIFMFQGFSIGIMGVILGIILSGIAIFILKNYEVIKIPEDIYFMSKVPVDFKLFESVLVVIGAILICLISSIYPSVKAANQDIIEAIKYE